jgi:mobilization protein NikA
MSSGRRKGPGRPPLPAAERKGKIFSVRLSREERAQVEAAAKARGLTAAAWARQVLLESSGSGS